MRAVPTMVQSGAGAGMGNGLLAVLGSRIASNLRAEPLTSASPAPQNGD